MTLLMTNVLASHVFARPACQTECIRGFTGHPSPSSTTIIFALGFDEAYAEICMPSGEDVTIGHDRRGGFALFIVP